MVRQGVDKWYLSLLPFHLIREQGDMKVVIRDQEGLPGSVCACVCVLGRWT